MNLFTINIILFFCLNSSLALICWNCQNAASNEDCLRAGRASYCSERDAVCEDEVRNYNWGRKMIAKRCKPKNACRANQNSRFARFSQCNSQSGSATCKCCCDRNMCNKDQLTCRSSNIQHDPSASQRTCKQITSVSRHTEKHCSGNNKPGSYCLFNCHGGYALLGSRKLTCKTNGQWDYPLPYCKPIACPRPPRPPKNGYVTCSNGRQLSSTCRFSCSWDHTLMGLHISTCVDMGGKSGIGVWSSSTPICRPLLCPFPSPLNHGRMTCSRGNKYNSHCRFECQENYVLHPKNLTKNRCLRSEKWSDPMPCCSLPCPPNLVVDFVVVMDSSSSVGAENWSKMKTFVRSFLDDFSVRDNAAHYSIIRYNSEVDVGNQIMLDDFPNDKRALLEAFDYIPYNGSGTHTGNALNYVARTLLKRGNRPRARDVVLLITDGESQDRVAIPARNVRRSGALLYVLPIRPPKGSLNFRQIQTIAGPGNDNNILRQAITGGFDALNEEFAREMSERLCSDHPCHDPFS